MKFLFKIVVFFVGGGGVLGYFSRFEENFYRGGVLTPKTSGCAPDPGYTSVQKEIFRSYSTQPSIS